MKPDKSRREERAGKARARILLQVQLSWLGGYPGQIVEGTLRWQPAPVRGQSQPAAVCVDGEKLRRTEYAIRKLVNNFPRALPQLVGNVDLWASRVEFLLEQLKTVVHQRQPLCSPLSQPEVPLPSGLLRDARRLQAEHPPLAPLADRMIWASLLDVEAGEQRLAWLRSEAEPVAQMLRNLPAEQAAPTLFLLADLAREDGNEAVRPFLELLADPRCFTVTLADLDTYRGEWAEYFDRRTERFYDQAFEAVPHPEPPCQPFGPDLLWFLRWLADQSLRTRRQAEKLAGLLLWPQLFDAPESRFKELQAHVETARARYRDSLSQLQQTNPHRVNRADIPSGSDLMRDFSTPTPASGFFSLLVAIQKGAKISEFAGLVRHLEQFPPWHDGLAVRAAAFSALEYQHLNRLQDMGRNYLRDYLQAWDRYARRHAGTSLIWKPWAEAVRDWNRDGWIDWDNDFADVLLDDLKQRALWPVFFEALAELAPREDCTTGSLPLLILLVQATRDARQTVELFRQCQDSGKLISLNLRRYLATAAVQAAVRLNQRPDRFPELLVQVYRLEEKRERSAASLEILACCWPSELGPEMLELAFRQQPAELLKLGSRLQMLLQTGLSAEPPAGGPAVAADWLARYPEDFHPLLNDLQRRCPNAERLAENILGTNFPDQRKTAAELQAIERKLAAQPDHAHLRQRAENLRQRLESVPPVSPQRLQNLQDKLLTAVGCQFVADWSRQVEAQLRDYLGRWLGTSSLPDWMLEELSLQVVIGLRDLKPAFRALGQKVLQAQAGGSLWNHLEEPANQQFLQRMRSRGLNMEAWLNPPLTRNQTAASGARLQLSLEHCSMEVLRMGGYFNTCLSPWEFNFFSAVANAVDVNKQVLFARDSEGEVVGRCLLALGDSGAIVPFHPYCHVEELKFDEITREVVRELAAAVGTVVTTHDQVSRLVAPDWYDDGSIDLGLAVNRSGSPLAELLENPPEAGLLDQLEVLLAPLGLTALTLPLVLGVINPEKITAGAFEQLLPVLQQHLEKLSPATRIRVALCAARTGHVELARREIRHQAPEFLRQSNHWEYRGCIDNQAIRLWAEHDPSAALRFLRKRRPAWVTSDQDESHERRALLAEIYTRLGRTHQAEKLTKQ